MSTPKTPCFYNSPLLAKVSQNVVLTENSSSSSPRCGRSASVRLHRLTKSDVKSRI